MEGSGLPSDTPVDVLVGGKRTAGADDGAPAKRARAAPARVSAPPVDARGEHGGADRRFRDAAGRRCVHPYVHTHACHAKQRWIGRPLLDVFAAEFGSHDREYFAAAIAAGALTVNGRAVPPLTLLRSNDLVAHHVHRHEPPVTGDAVLTLANDAPGGGDGGIVAVCKPGGVPVHGAGPFRFNALTSILAAGDAWGDGDGSGAGDSTCAARPRPAPLPFPLHVVHRLDRLTSGVVLFATSPDGARRVCDALQRAPTAGGGGDGGGGVGGAAQAASGARSTPVSKLYLAVVAGCFPCGPHVASGHGGVGSGDSGGVGGTRSDDACGAAALAQQPTAGAGPSDSAVASSGNADADDEDEDDLARRVREWFGTCAAPAASAGGLRTSEEESGAALHGDAFVAAFWPPADGAGPGLRWEAELGGGGPGGDGDEGAGGAGGGRATAPAAASAGADGAAAATPVPPPAAAVSYSLSWVGGLPAARRGGACGAGCRRLPAEVAAVPSAATDGGAAAAGGCACLGDGGGGWLSVTTSVGSTDPRNGRHGVLAAPAPAAEAEVGGAGARRAKAQAPASRASETRFRRLAYDATRRVSLLLVRPVSGRTHQIRVHAAWLGFPIDDDPLYGATPAGGGLGGDGPRSEGGTGGASAAGFTAAAGDAASAAAAAVAAPAATAAMPSGAPPPLAALAALCVSCTRGPAAEFTPAQLRSTGIHLHAWRYAGPGWDFTAPPPPWARRFGSGRGTT